MQRDSDTSIFSMSVERTAPRSEGCRSMTPSHAHSHLGAPTAAAMAVNGGAVLQELVRSSPLVEVDANGPFNEKQAPYLTEDPVTGEWKMCEPYLGLTRIAGIVPKEKCVVLGKRVDHTDCETRAYCAVAFGEDIHPVSVTASGKPISQLSLEYSEGKPCVNHPLPVVMERHHFVDPESDPLTLHFQLPVTADETLASYTSKLFQEVLSEGTLELEYADQQNIKQQFEAQFPQYKDVEYIIPYIIDIKVESCSTPVNVPFEALLVADKSVNPSVETANRYISSGSMRAPPSGKAVQMVQQLWSSRGTMLKKKAVQSNVKDTYTIGTQPSSNYNPLESPPEDERTVVFCHAQVNKDSVGSIQTVLQRKQKDIDNAFFRQWMSIEPSKVLQEFEFLLGKSKVDRNVPRIENGADGARLVPMSFYSIKVEDDYLKQHLIMWFWLRYGRAEFVHKAKGMLSENTIKELFFKNQNQNPNDTSVYLLVPIKYLRHAFAHRFSKFSPSKYVMPIHENNHVSCIFRPRSYEEFKLIKANKQSPCHASVEVQIYFDKFVAYDVKKQEDALSVFKLWSSDNPFTTGNFAV